MEKDNSNLNTDDLSALNGSAEYASLPEPVASEQEAPADIDINPSALQIPQFMPDLPPWKEEDYRHCIQGSGAFKLAESAVAPLVAAARGYRKLTEENYTTVLKAAGLHASSKQYKNLRALILDGHDAMTMPWYSTAGISQARHEGIIPKPISYQFRPARTTEYDLPKYAFAKGAVTPIDVHPATPTPWLDGTQTILFAEGLLKGDSALTAYLHAHGISYEEMSWDGVGSPSARLGELMNRIPEKDRLLIMSMAGVYNTHQNPGDYREVVLKGRDAWIGFDADYSTNYQVHRAASGFRDMLHRNYKMNSIQFLFPEVSVGDGTLAKAGIDDFLAHTGDWNALVKTLSADLGDAPSKNLEDRPGNWRVSKEGTETEECVAVTDPVSGGIAGYRWDTKLFIGGKIQSMEILRQPTPDEMTTGEFAAQVQPHEIQDSRTEVELQWMNNGVKESALVQGPDKIVGYNPDQWERRGAYIPQDVLCHVEWPPTGPAGTGFLRAIKGNSESMQRRTRWMQMGWVPQPGGQPVFLIGDQVIGELTATETIVAGITERELDPAKMYGVGHLPVDPDFRNQEYRDLVRSDLEKVYNAYIRSEAWTEPATAHLVVAAGLRPTIPVRPVCTYYLIGEKGSGKSWTAEKMMSFWEARRGSWLGQLPGSAKDTVSYTENALSVAPIWVMDDLAPSASAKQSESEQSKIADVIRSVFNNAGKGRMNADGTSRVVKSPISQLVITAENTLNVASARERVIHLNLGRGALNPSSGPTDEINRLQAQDGAAARLSHHMIRWVQREAMNPETGANWATFMSSLTEAMGNIKNYLKEEMKARKAKGGSLERISTLATDALLPYYLLQRMAEFVGCDDDLVEELDLMNMADPVIDLLVAEHQENQLTSPGIALSRALSRLLTSNLAHVVAPDSPLNPPISTEDNNTLTNASLGWASGGSNDELRPMGQRIGWVIEPKGAKGEKIVMFNLDLAFGLAQRHYPDLIPHGQGLKVSQRALWNEKIAVQDVWKRQLDGKSARDTIRVTSGGVQMRGVPIYLNTVLNGGTVVTESKPDDATEE